MRKYLVLLMAGMFLLPAPVAGWGAEDCRCRAEGQYHPVGSLICMRTGSTSRMALCEMNLNNPSWKFLEEGCPVALNMTPRFSRALAL